MRLFTLLTIFFTLTVFYGYSQPTPPPNPGGGGTPVPISGIEYLLGIGGLYGLKKIMGKSKKKTNE